MAPKAYHRCSDEWGTVPRFGALNKSAIIARGISVWCGLSSSRRAFPSSGPCGRQARADKLRNQRWRRRDRRRKRFIGTTCGFSHQLSSRRGHGGHGTGREEVGRGCFLLIEGVWLSWAGVASAVIQHCRQGQALFPYRSSFHELGIIHLGMLSSEEVICR